MTRAMSDHNVITLADGRELVWAEQGDPEGNPVLALHGTPGSRLSRYSNAEELLESGVRQITYDRPGGGYSTPHPGRTVADVVRDVAAVLDAAGVERLGVIGTSGGGPHVLAVATLLAERCALAYCLVGVAPFHQPDLDPFEGMDAENIRRFKAAQRGRDAALAELGPDLESIVARALEDPMTAMGAMKLPESDLAIIRESGPSTAAQYAEAARQGAISFADDFVAISSPWGFDPRDVKAPVIIEYGLEDVNVPPGHGAWLAANVPNIEVRTRTGGHRMPNSELLARLVEVSRAR